MGVVPAQKRPLDEKVLEGVPRPPDHQLEVDGDHPLVAGPPPLLAEQEAVVVRVVEPPNLPGRERPDQKV